MTAEEQGHGKLKFLQYMAHKIRKEPRFSSTPMAPQAINPPLLLREDPPIRLVFFNPSLWMVSECRQQILDLGGEAAYDEMWEKAMRERESTNHQDPSSEGGSPKNAVHVERWVLGDKRYMTFSGCVGKDDFIDTMLRCFESNGVGRPSFCPGTTGLCSCLCDETSERHYSTERLDLDIMLFRAQRLAGVLFANGCFFAHSPDVVVALADACAESQVMFSLSLPADGIRQDQCQILLRVLHRVDVLFSNEAEVKAIASELRDGDTVENTARFLAARDGPETRDPRVVLVSRGPKPVLVVRGQDSPAYFPVPDGRTVKDCESVAGAFLALYALCGDVTRAAEAGVTEAATEIVQQTEIAQQTEIVQQSSCHSARKNLWCTVL